MTDKRTMWEGEAYCAVRETPSGVFFDDTTLGCSKMRVRARVKEANELTPEWASLNPVTRIAKIKFEEVNE